MPSNPQVCNAEQVQASPSGTGPMGFVGDSRPRYRYLCKRHESLHHAASQRREGELEGALEKGGV